jgi:predicted metal-dependent phosphoesterase TrpH
VNDGRVDLHIHSSKSSDGDFTPFHLLRLAKENGFRAIAIADHDTVAAYPEAIDQARRIGVELVPSVELTTLFKGREFHLLLPFVRWNSRSLKAILDRIAAARAEEAKARIERLRGIGFDIGWDEVSRKFKAGPPLGVNIAQVLIDKGRREKTPALEKYCREENRLLAPYAFYRDYFLEGKPAHVPKRTVGLLDILGQAAKVGGVPVLAHPGAYFERAGRDDLLELRTAGLAGLEVYSSYHDREQTRFYLSLAEDLGLVATAGSDFHGRVKPHVTFGYIRQGDYRMVEALRSKRRDA